jgi:hypothetical protein
MTNEASATERKRPGRPPKNRKKAAIGARIAQELRDSLVRIAERHGRSFSQQLELLLELAVKNEFGWGTPELDARLAAIEAALAAVQADQTAFIEEFERLVQWLYAEAVPNSRATAADPLAEPPVVRDSRAPADRVAKPRRAKPRVARVRTMHVDPGEPGQPGRVIPVDISVTMGSDGPSFAFRYQGQVTRDEFIRGVRFPLDPATAQRLLDELRAVAGIGAIDELRAVAGIGVSDQQEGTELPAKSPRQRRKG